MTQDETTNQQKEDRNEKKDKEHNWIFGTLLADAVQTKETLDFHRWITGIEIVQGRSSAQRAASRLRASTRAGSSAVGAGHVTNGTIFRVGQTTIFFNVAVPRSSRSRATITISLARIFCGKFLLPLATLVLDVFVATLALVVAQTTFFGSAA